MALITAGRAAPRRLATALAAFGAVLAWLLTTAPAAWAHAELLETTPANGAQLPSVPAEVLLRFSEQVSPVKGESKILDSDGGEVHDGKVSTSDGGSVLHIPIKDGIGDGVYTVSWRVVSADSHPIHGAFVFSVGEEKVDPLSGAATETGSDGPVGALFWLFRWGGYAGLALLLGGGYFLSVCWPGGRADPRAVRMVRAGLVTSAASAVGSLLMQGPYAVGGSLGRVFDPGVIEQTVTSDYGVAVGARLVLLVLAGYALTWLLTARAAAEGLPRWRYAAMAATGVALPVSWGLAGHASAGDLPWLALVTDAVHLTAMSTWVGGLAVLITCVLPRDRLAPAEAAEAVPRFSRTAMVAVSALVVTGTFQAWREVRTVDALSGTDYGRLLIFKLAAFGVLLSLGALSRSVVQRRYVTPVLAEAGRASRAAKRAERERAEAEREAIGQLRQSVRLEAGIALGVLALTAALVATPPGEVAGGFQAAPASAAEGDTGQPGAGPFDRQLPLPEGRGRVEVSVDPAIASANQMSVTLTDPSGAPLEVPGVTAELTLPERDLGPLPVELTKKAPGLWSATGVTIPSAGTWTLALNVRVGEFDELPVSVDVPVA